MLSKELSKLKHILEYGLSFAEIDREQLLKELKDLEKEYSQVTESLALSGRVCRTCGRSL